MTTELKNKLFVLIRSGLDLEAPAIELTEGDCPALLQIGMRQSILPILYRGIKEMEAPEDAIRSIDNARLKDNGQTIRINYSIDIISAALEKAQISYIPLKGAVLRHLYPEKNLRTSCDIDLLVHEEDIDETIEIIENNTGFGKGNVRYHDISMVSPYVHLELHFSIMENMENIDKLLSQVWDYAVPDEGSRYKLTPEFQVFHVIAHMSYHMVHGGLGIRPFLDLRLLRTKTEYDEETVRRMCSDCSILSRSEELQPGTI